MPLPDIAPTSRNYNLGTEYIAQKDWRLGGTTRRHYGEYVQEATLSLRFENIDDADADAIVAAYDDTLGVFPIALLPNNWYAGLSEEAIDEVLTLGGWFFSSPPQVESVQPGVSSVSVSMVAEVLMPLPLGGTGSPPDTGVICRVA